MNQELQAAAAGQTWLAEDGTALLMRPIEEGDAADLVSFVRRLSYGARYFRYGSADFNLTYEQAQRACRPNPARRLHLLVLAQANGSPAIIASGRIIFEPGETHCELEMSVSDSWRRHGVGRRLLSTLIDAARWMELDEMRARVLVTNAAMASFLRDSGFLVSDAGEDEAIREARLCIASSRTAALAR